MNKKTAEIRIKGNVFETVNMLQQVQFDIVEAFEDGSFHIKVTVIRKKTAETILDEIVYEGDFLLIDLNYTILQEKDEPTSD